MNSIIKNYNSLIKKYHEMEQDSTEKEIHDKRVILRRVFPILAVFKINSSKIKNGEKAFKLFGKLRDIQVQILKLESIEPSESRIEYLAFLKGIELELQEKVEKFSKEKHLKFPVIKKKSKIEKLKLIRKAEESLIKLITRTESQIIVDAQDTHKIRIELKKFRYQMEVLSYIEHIDEAMMDELKLYQDRLGEIQDYEILINGIKKYYRKRKPDEEPEIELFEDNQNQLIVAFDHELELFISTCREVLTITPNDTAIISSEVENDLNEEQSLTATVDELTSESIEEASLKSTEKPVVAKRKKTIKEPKN